MISQLLDRLDARLCASGLRQPKSWAQLSHPVRLYAGNLSADLPQFQTFTGLTPFRATSRIIPHDMTHPMNLPDNCVEVFQSEDVFEHIEYDRLDAVFDEIYRVLKPGGFFRLSMPDYRCPLWRSRTLEDESGQLLFDPGGGGRLADGQVIDGGHVWFPMIENVRALFDTSQFEDVRYLQYFDETGSPVVLPTDHSLAYVQRSAENDSRAGNAPLSIIVDAFK